MFVIPAFLIFLGAFMAAAYYAWIQPRQQVGDALGRRLRELRVRSGAGARTAGSDLVRRSNKGTFDFVGEFFTLFGLLNKLQETIDQANLKYKASTVFVLCVAIGAVAYLFFGVLGLRILSLRLVFALILGYIPIFYVNTIRSRRLARFEELLPDAIDLFNRSMKAGHNLQAGLETIAGETLDPVKMEFRKVMEELALGSPTEQALHRLGARVPIIDLKFFITGLILQRQTGANMVDMLENLALLIRERLNLNAKLKAGTAQQRLSAGLLCSMPIVVGLGFWVLKPEFIEILYKDERGSMILTYAIVSEILGILVIRKLASPKF
ncbi:MAG: type II secretion system F family protein [Acidobacteria bacterium]|nr:type II secretion system F family protein [Acidobacteriota bacterium]